MLWLYQVLLPAAVVQGGTEPPSTMAGGTSLAFIIGIGIHF